MSKKKSKPKKASTKKGDKYTVYAMVQLCDGEECSENFLTQTVAPSRLETWELFNSLSEDFRNEGICVLKKFTMVQQ